MMNTRHNRIAQLGLLVMGITAGALWLLAARPPARPFGRYAAVMNTPQPVYGVTGQVIAQITVSDAALINLPPKWGLSDAICMVVRMARGDTATSPDTSDVYAQGDWDRPYRDWVVFDEGAIRTQARDGTRLKLATPLLTDYLLPYAGFNVRLYGVEPVVLEKNQSAVQLLCYYQYYLIDNTDIPHVPFYHELALRARNAAVYAYPAYHFRYNTLPKAEDAATTFDLPRLSLNDYLRGISVKFPDLAQTLTPAQQEQIGTEIPGG